MSSSKISIILALGLVLQAEKLKLSVEVMFLYKGRVKGYKFYLLTRKTLLLRILSLEVAFRYKGVNAIVKGTTNGTVADFHGII